MAGRHTEDSRAMWNYIHFTHVVHVDLFAKAYICILLVSPLSSHLLSNYTK
jgi:hypothetical protein